MSFFYGTAASLFGAEGSHRQRSRRRLLPFPLLLSVSANYGCWGCIQDFHLPRLSAAKSDHVGCRNFSRYVFVNPWATPYVSPQVLGIGHRRMGATLASCLPVVQLLDADVLHLQPPIQGGGRTLGHVVRCNAGVGTKVCLRLCPAFDGTTDGCPRHCLLSRAPNLQHSMSSHLVPALRALLPVAFLCEVCRATYNHACSGGTVQSRYLPNLPSRGVVDYLFMNRVSDGCGVYAVEDLDWF